MDRKLKDPEQEEKGGIPAAATSKGLLCARRKGFACHRFAVTAIGQLY